MPSFAEPEAFLDAEAFDLDDVDRVGTGLSFALELWEFDRALPPFVEEEASLLDRRFLRSLGISEEVGELGRIDRQAAVKWTWDIEITQPQRFLTDTLYIHGFVGSSQDLEQRYG